ncbi:FadR/GntR family transcriptional regulator [Streptomyces sp. NPDC049627]|uniref:FadR/GntR family transcriptional regulator n=1 Tax=Streptomyces sp. NPDC049627 TaxID=3365595 RepID=UPI0037A389DA
MGAGMGVLPRESTVDVLEKRLREDILAGRHPAGSYLPPERDLADEFGVNRTTLKHAFGRLVQAGLLETRHGVGTRVRDFLRLGGADLLPMLVRHSPDWIGEIFEVRRSIGALIAERAAARATPAQVAELRSLIAAVRDADGGEDVQLADAEVHRALARATGNRVYVLLTNTLFNAYLPVRAALVDPFLDAHAAHDRLAPVVDAVAAGDQDAARVTAGAYLSATERIMLEGLARAGRRRDGAR